MYKRIVVKIGTKVLSNPDGRLDREVLEHIIEQAVLLRKKNIQVILVTSGAVGTGRGLLTLKKDIGSVVQKQVFAAVGQVRLMGMYADLFEKHGYFCAQVLATKEDFRDRQHYANMKNCFENLLQDKIIPIVNENDVVAISELVFTDNDELAELVATQLRVDVVVILTSVDGVLVGGRTISEINLSNAVSFKKHITPERSAGGRGGMRTKFSVSLKLAKRGITTYIVNGKKRNALTDVIAGKRIGTKFLPRKKAASYKR